jgi:hypothetical protein
MNAWSLLLRSPACAFPFAWSSRLHGGTSSGSWTLPCIQSCFSSEQACLLIAIRNLHCYPIGAGLASSAECTVSPSVQACFKCLLHCEPFLPQALWIPIKACHSTWPHSKNVRVLACGPQAAGLCLFLYVYSLNVYPFFFSTSIYIGEPHTRRVSARSWPTLTHMYACHKCVFTHTLIQLQQMYVPRFELAEEMGGFHAATEAARQFIALQVRGLQTMQCALQFTILSHCRSGCPVYKQTTSFDSRLKECRCKLRFINGERERRG